MEGSGAGGDAFASATAPLTWQNFLERMRHPSAAEFVKSIKSFIVTFSNNAPDPEVDSNAVQDFLARMEDAFRAHPLWAGSSEEELESTGEGLEKYVMTKLYNRVFATVPEDARSDEELFEKMGLLQHFIRPENLDIKPEFQNESSWLLAQKELQKINMYKAPRDKLVCILNCCKVINNLLVNASFASGQNPPGADEFLPVLIYVTIKANPPQLHSNLQYIQRFRRRTRLVSESAYFFTNILSAESFVWNIDGEALSIKEADFQRKMDAAREHLFGLSTPSGPSDMNKINSENSPSRLKDTSRNDSIRDLENEGRAFSEAEIKQPLVERKQPTASDLQTKGSSELLKEDNASRYFQDYPYLYARAGDLTVSDVEELLSCYKRLVLQHISLSKGIGVKPETHHTSEPVKQLVEVKDLPKNTDNISLSEGIGVEPETHHTSEPVKQLVEVEDLPKNTDNISLSEGIGVEPETHHTSEPVKQLVEVEDLPKYTDNGETNQVSTVETQFSTESIEELMNLSTRAESSENEIVDSSTGGTEPENSPDDTVSGNVVPKIIEDA